MGRGGLGWGKWGALDAASIPQCSKVTSRAEPRAGGLCCGTGLWEPPGWNTSCRAVLGGCPRSAEVAGAEPVCEMRSLTLRPDSGVSEWVQPLTFGFCCVPTAL